MWIGEHLLHPTLCIKPFCSAFVQMSSWKLDVVGMDHMAVGMDVDVAAGVESQKYAPMSDVRYWELVESYGLQTLCECRERRRGYPTVVNSRKKLPYCRRRWLVWATTSLF